MTSSEKIKVQSHSYGPDLYPVPVLLVSCEAGGIANIIPICWTGVMCSDPPVVYISVRPERFSYRLISGSKKFVINIPPGDMLETVDQCGKTQPVLPLRIVLIGKPDNYPVVSFQECQD